MRGRPPVILGYHGIGTLGTRDDPLQLYVPPEGLCTQVRSLQRRGYEFVTMSEFADRAAAAGRPPPGIAALTFDDGTVDHATVLPSVLEQLGVPGTVYVCPGLSGQPYPWASIEASVRFMTEEEMVELSSHPLIEIGAHTNEHRELHEADAETALEEMTACKSTLEALLGVEIVSFCYPRCHYSEAARASAPEAGFKSAVTCGLWGTWDLFELKREVLHSCDGPLVAGLRTRGLYSGLGGRLQARVFRRVVLTLDRVVTAVAKPDVRARRDPPELLNPHETGGPGSCLYVPPGSDAAGLVAGLGWLWGLGSPADRPDAAAVGFGTEADAAELARLVGEGRLAGAVVAIGDAGGPTGTVPARVRVAGVPEFDGGTRVRGEFTLFTGGEPAVRSSLGVHAVIDGDVLAIGYEPERDWGRLDSFWAYEAIAEFLAARISKPLAKLPPIGCLRLDDTPGTAQHQLEEREKSDRRQRPRLRRLARRMRAANAVLNVAVAAQALDPGGRRVPLEQVWPGSVAALREGIEIGAYEPILHGLLHLNPESLERGEIEYTEFARLDAAQAAEHLDRALEWQSRVLAKPRVFVAPAWAYGPAADEEAAKRGLVRWYRARPGALLDDGRFYETLIGELLGLYRLDYSPLVRLAAVGIPPVIAMHGALLDGRLASVKANREATVLARLVFKRDVSRLIEVEGIRWVGAGELIDLLEAHSALGPALDAAPQPG